MFYFILDKINLTIFFLQQLIGLKTEDSSFKSNVYLLSLKLALFGRFLCIEGKILFTPLLLKGLFICGGASLSSNYKKLYYSMLGINFSSFLLSFLIFLISNLDLKLST